MQKKKKRILRQIIESKQKNRIRFPLFPSSVFSILFIFHSTVFLNSKNYAVTTTNNNNSIIGKYSAVKQYCVTNYRPNILPKFIDMPFNKSIVINFILSNPVK